MLDAVIYLLPSPIDTPDITGILDDESEASRKSDDGENFSALAFKIANDPYVGNLTFLEFTQVFLIQVTVFSIR